MLPIVLLVILYVSVAALVGFIGRRRKFGAWGYFFGSILLTPIIGVLLIMASDRRPTVA
ncbi:MAG: hypothetical protein ACOYOH_02325 [Paracraurococcus sp.]|jgi:hypothetical protein